MRIPSGIVSDSYRFNSATEKVVDARDLKDGDVALHDNPTDRPYPPRWCEVAEFELNKMTGQARFKGEYDGGSFRDHLEPGGRKFIVKM